MQDSNKFSKIAPANRAQLIDDALNLARGGILDYRIAMNLTKYLAHEKDYVPWKAAIYALHFIDSMMLKSGEYYKFKVSNFTQTFRLRDKFINDILKFLITEIHDEPRRSCL